MIKLVLEEGRITEMDKIIKFGMYPQWEIDKNSLDGDPDGMEYFKIGIGDVAYINDIEEKWFAYIDWEKQKNKVYYFKRTPIEWRVLAENDETLFVLSEYCIDCKQFNEQAVPVIWEKSTIRKWLNDEFFFRAFNDNERGCILETEIENECNPISFTPNGGRTREKVFLLSYREVLNSKFQFESYMMASSTRQAKNTDYARVMGALTNPEMGTGWWWLRNPGMTPVEGEHVQINAAGNYLINKPEMVPVQSGRVDSSGAVYFTGKPIHVFGSVRPAMVLDKKGLGELIR